MYITGSCVIREAKVYKDGRYRREAGPGARAFFQDVYSSEEIQYPKFYKMDGLSQLGFLATEILLKGTFDASQYQPGEVAVVLSNANASLDTDLRYYQSAADIPSPALFVYTLPNIVVGEICIRNGFKGENSFFVFKAFDATFITRYVEGLMAGDLTKTCICGWVDCLGEAYEAALFLVEATGTLPFTAENLSKIYTKDHG